MSRSEQEQQFQQERKIAQIKKCFENIADDYRFIDSLDSDQQTERDSLGIYLQNYQAKNIGEKQLQTVINQGLKAIQRVQKRLSTNDRYSQQIYVSQQSRFNKTVLSHVIIDMYLKYQYVFRFLSPIKRDKYNKFLVDDDGNYIYDTNIQFSSVSHCLSLRSDYGEIIKAVESDTYHFSDLSFCGSAWLCAFCAYKIQLKRRDELDSLNNWCQSNNKRLIMVTYTVPHRYNDLGNITIGRLRRAYGLLNSNNSVVNSLSSVGYAGRVTSTEIRLGKNGWHPHLHVLYIIDNTASGRSILKMYNKIKSAWLTSCQTAGFLGDAQPCDIAAFKAHSTMLSYKNSDAVLADYINKSADTFGGDDTKGNSGEKISDEMSMGNTKTSRVQVGEKSVSGFGLLERITRYQRPTDVIRWVEYALMTKGLAMIQWSRGLKGLVGIDDKTDKELATEATSDKVPEIGFGACHYAIMSKYNVRAESLLLAKEVGVYKLDECLRHIVPDMPVLLGAGEVPTDEWLVATRFLGGHPVSAKYYRYNLHPTANSSDDVIKRVRYHLRGNTLLSILRCYYELPDDVLGSLGRLYDWMADHEIDAIAMHDYVDYVDTVTCGGIKSAEIREYVVPVHPAPSIADAVDPVQIDEQITLF